MTWALSLNTLIAMLVGIVNASSCLGQDAVFRDRYTPIAERIIRAGRERNSAHEKLIRLCDDIGHRITGSPQLDEAIEWAQAELRADGQENVRAEPVLVRHWIRGEESAQLVSPRSRPIKILGLGGSVATPVDGLEADVIVFADKAEFDAADPAVVAGKIVLWNHPMPPYSPQTGSGYGDTVQYRTQGARWAAQKGAVASLVRSVTATSLYSPHTGTMRYGDATVKIPGAAVTVEDAEMLARFQRRGITPRIKLQMTCRDGGDVRSANVLGEIVGSELPEEIVVIGGHLDSWDVGQGAQDDGAGCVAAMEALAILRRLNLRPKRTLRVVLWTDEEQGGAGATSYAARHASERHVAGIESDSGGFTPEGLSLDVADARREAQALAQLEEILQLLSPLRRMKSSVGYSGADVSKLKSQGTVCFGLDVDGRYYFDTHHTEADTVDKVDPQQLGECAITLAVAGFVLADMPTPIGGPVQLPAAGAGQQ